MRRTHAATLLLILVAGCATTPQTPSRGEADPAAFSVKRPGETPEGWLPVRLMRLKKMTEYMLVDYGGTTVMKAIANASASGLRHVVNVDLNALPFLQWRWKVPQMIEASNNTASHVEDSPARVIVTFEGGRDQLPPEEQMNYDLALAMTGNKMPFATLMYIWENRLPEGTIITHHMTSRVKMVVAGSGSRNLNTWHDERRNVLADYRRAFGEDPPRVASVGIMSDSDNTGASVTAYFGDIRFAAR
jgi:hypothetical protein